MEAMMLTHKSAVLPAGTFNGEMAADVPSFEKLFFGPYPEIQIEIMDNVQ